MQRFFGGVSRCALERKEDKDDLEQLAKATDQLKSSMNEVAKQLNRATEDENHPMHGVARGAADDFLALAMASMNISGAADGMNQLAKDEPSLVKDWRCWNQEQRDAFWKKQMERLED
jgi:hypothetical protein